VRASEASSRLIRAGVASGMDFTWATVAKTRRLPSVAMKPTMSSIEDLLSAYMAL